MKVNCLQIGFTGWWGFEQVEEGDESDAGVGGELGKVRAVLSGVVF